MQFNHSSINTPLIAIALSTIASFAVTILALISGITIVYQNIYYIPIVLASYYYGRRGFYFSGIISLVYFVSIVAWTLEQAIVLQALVRVAVFMSVAAFIAYLSTEWKRERHLLSIGNEILGVIASSLDQDDMIGRFFEKIMTLLDIQAAAMILLDTKTMRPNRVIHRWFELTDEAFNEKIKNAESALKDTVVDKAIACRKLDTSLFGIAPDSGSIYAFPVLFEVTPVGILLMYRRSKADIRDNERLIFRGICNALGGYLMKDIVQKELDRTRMQREELLEQLQKVNEELKKAQEETNLYLDIMAHDINNANTAALGYGEFLIETLGERERELAKKMLIAVKQSTEIIKNVSTIRKLRESKQPLQPVELEGVIRSQMNHYPEAKCTFAGTTAVVMADDLLGEVFNNLIGNSVKFGGAGVQIEISVMDRDEYVEVTVADTGPGIPDEQKPLIFTRFGKGKSKKSGKGLGLFICRMLIERYGGRIWAEDRVIGSPEQGAAIKFTLQKARVPAN